MTDPAGAVAPPTGRAPLTPQQRKAAIVAGAVAGGLFGIGWGLTTIAAGFLVVVVALGALLGLLLGGADITGGFGAVIIGVLVVALLVGVGLLVVSAIVSKRILVKGGVHRPTAVTWLSLLIVLVLNTISQRLFDPSLGFTDSDVPVGQTVVAFVVLVVVAVGTGIGAWLLMALALRPKAGEPVVAALTVEAPVVGYTPTPPSTPAVSTPAPPTTPPPPAP